MTKGAKTSQFYNFMLALQKDWLLKNNWSVIPKELVEQVKHYYPKADVAVICHDADCYTKEDEPDHVAGDIKPEHIHIAFHLPAAKTIGMVARKFGVAENFVQVFNGRNGKANMFGYLCHLTDGARQLGKHIYPLKNVESSFDYPAYVAGVEADVTAKAIEKPMVLQQVLDGRLRLIDFILPDKNGSDALTAFYVQNKSFVETAISTRYSRLMATHGQGMKLRIIYIEGCAGSGKTSYAKAWAMKQYRDYYFASSKNDPLQDYKGEEVIIFDDARPDMFGADDWLRLLDPYTNESSVKSRFVNKYLAVKCIILTSIHPWRDFFRLCPRKGGGSEPVDQFLRRFDFVFEFPKPAMTDAGTTITRFAVSQVVPCEKYEHQFVDGKGKAGKMELGYTLHQVDADREFVIAQREVEPEIDLSLFDV